jgi:hypothetical protein
MSDDIRDRLVSARVEAARLASEQQAWREHVAELFARALEAGMTPAEIVELLGLTAKWELHRRVPKPIRDFPFLYGTGTET